MQRDHFILKMNKNLEKKSKLPFSTLVLSNPIKTKESIQQIACPYCKELYNAKNGLSDHLDSCDVRNEELYMILNFKL